MTWFFRKKPIVARIRTSLGTFSFDGTGWITDPRSGALIVLSNGSELDTRAIDRAQGLIENIDFHRERALAYVRSSGSNVWDGNGQLALEEIDITNILNHEFGLTFGLKGQPDFTVTVEFRNQEPYSVWAAD